MNISFDIDGVIIDFFKAITWTMSRTDNPSEAEILTWDFRAAYGIEHSPDGDEHWDMCVDRAVEISAAMPQQFVYPRIGLALYDLHNVGHKLHFVSNRKLRHMLPIVQHVAPFATSVRANVDLEERAEYLEAIRSNVHVDDKIENLEALDVTGVVPVCRTHAFNTNWSGLSIPSLDRLLPIVARIQL